MNVRLDISRHNIEWKSFEIDVAGKERIISNDPKFLSKIKIKDLQNSKECTVYFEIDGEGDVL